MNHEALAGWLPFLIIAHVAGFWILLFWAFRLRRQIKCLHFCFIGISDWGIDTLKEVRDTFIESEGRDNCPFKLLDIEKEWADKITFYSGLQKRAGVVVPKANHIHYIMDDLG